MVDTSHGTECNFCPQNFRCGGLQSILAILEKHAKVEQDANARLRFESLLKKIADTGYHYPDGPIPCELVNDPGRLAKLTQEAINFYRSLNC